MVFSQVPKANEKGIYKEIERYGRHDLEAILAATRDRGAETVEFKDELWSLVTLDSLISVMPDEHDQDMMEVLPTAHISTKEVSTAGTKRRTDLQADDLPARKTKWADRTEPRASTQLSFDEQLIFANTAKFEQYRQDITGKKLQAKQQHQKTLAIANVKRKAAKAKATSLLRKYHDAQDINDLTAAGVGRGVEVRIVVCSDDRADQSKDGVATDQVDVTTESDSTARSVDKAPKKLSHYWSGGSDEFTQQQKDEIKALAKSRPRYLYHVHSCTGKRHTKGSIDEIESYPAAVVEGKNLYNTIYDFPLRSKLIENFGRRILWDIRKADQFSSYTTSLLFAFVHAMGRKVRGETGITISLIDTDEATTMDGDPVEFYYVPQLQRILGMADYRHWHDIPLSKLLSPWYTHEYVVHGSMQLGGNAFHMVSLKEFRDAGLEDFLPGLHDSEAIDEMKRLYSRCVEMRVQWHSRAASAPFTVDFLDHAAKLARLFIPPDASQSSDADAAGFVHELHLQIFLDFVGLSRRQGNEEVFTDYILDNFSAANVEDVIYPGMSLIPNNLPETMHTLARLREARAALSINAIMPITVIPPNRIACVDRDFDSEGRCDRPLDVKFAFLKAAKMKRVRLSQCAAGSPLALNNQTEPTSNSGSEAEEESSGEADAFDPPLQLTERAPGEEESPEESPEEELCAEKVHNGAAV